MWWLALYIAITAGFKNIYVYGLDYSYFNNCCIVDKQNNLYIKNHHFYDTEEGEPEFYFIGNKFFGEYLHAQGRTFQIFMDLESYAEALGSKVYNKNIASYVDAFEKIDLGETPE